MPLWRLLHTVRQVICGPTVGHLPEESPKYIRNLLVTRTKPVGQNTSLESYLLSKEQAAASRELTTLRSYRELLNLTCPLARNRHIRDLTERFSHMH